MTWRVLGPAVAAAALLGWAVLAPSAALGAGWLIAMLFWLGIALGALALLAVGTLTGGRWLAAMRPGLAPAAATVPAFLLVGLPLLPAMRGLYPWVTQPEAAAPGVAALYLNPAGWLLRSALALAGWSVLALLLRRDGAPRLVAALGLCFHAVAVSMVGMDWVVSATPRFVSTAFGTALAVTQMFAALAWVAVLRVVPAARAADLGALLLAATLGTLYLGFAQYLVIWYGNLPAQVPWYVARQASWWGWLDGAAVALSALLPFGVLLRQRWRADPGALQRVGGAVLVGLLLHLAWLVAPGHGLAALLAAGLAVVAIGGGWLALADRRLGDAHGR